MMAVSKKSSGGSDKKTIGVASANEASLASVIQAGNFGSELDAAKFAMAHAISQGVEPGTTEGASTKWNIGTVDASGSLRALIESIYGETAEPYRLIEHLINEGLRRLTPGESVPPDVVGLLFAVKDPEPVAEPDRGAAL
jgi:hypothetical protein